MIFPSFSTFIPAILAFGSIVSSAAPAPSPAGLGDLLSGLTGGLGGLGGSVPSTGGATDALDIVQTLKDTTGSLLKQITSLSAADGGLTQAGGLDILTQLTSAITSATGAAGTLPAGSVPASEPTESSALGTQVAELVSEILRDVVAIVAQLGALPLLGPLLLAVDGLLVGLLTALAPTVGGLLANVSALLLSLGGQNLAGLVANLGAGLTAGLLTLAV
ncbi:hypothetical protein BDY24DRAFT_433764 [Mrakia frigida]|uniref:uncharacterized protein n=1 Tax=Mrakia frigida TaxID=29902 RepID=UPI003FCBF263